MQMRERVAYLTDWALRDVHMARKQTRLDMQRWPGIELQVARQLELREMLGQHQLPEDWHILMDEIIPLPAPITTKEKK